MNTSTADYGPLYILKLGIFLLAMLPLTTTCFIPRQGVSDEIVQTPSTMATISNLIGSSSTSVSTPVTTRQASQLNQDFPPQATSTLIPREIPVSTPEEISSCPVTPIQEDFWSHSGPVAGEFPVWISSWGHTRYSNLGRIVLPPESGELEFNEGRLTKALIFVDKSVEGDLTITGKRLDGPELVYFTNSAGLFTDINETTIQLMKPPATAETIPVAHVSSHLPEPAGKAHHGMGLLYLSPGCYQFTATINRYVVQIILELVNE